MVKWVTLAYVIDTIDSSQVLQLGENQCSLYKKMYWHVSIYIVIYGNQSNNLKDLMQTAYFKRADDACVVGASSVHMKYAVCIALTLHRFGNHQ